MKDLIAAFIAFMGVVFIGIIVLVYSSMVYGLILYKSYHWFVMTTFQVPSITYYQAIGLVFFAGVFKNVSYKKDDRKTDWSLLLLTPWLSLAIMYVVHIYIS